MWHGTWLEAPRRADVQKPAADWVSRVPIIVEELLLRQDLVSSAMLDQELLGALEVHPAIRRLPVPVLANCDDSA